MHSYIKIGIVVAFTYAIAFAIGVIIISNHIAAL